MSLKCDSTTNNSCPCICASMMLQKTFCYDLLPTKARHFYPEFLFHPLTKCSMCLFISATFAAKSGAATAPYN